MPRGKRIVDLQLDLPTESTLSANADSQIVPTQRDHRAEKTASLENLARNLSELRILRDSGGLGDQIIQVAQSLILCGLPYRPTNRSKIVRRARLADGSVVSVTFAAVLDGIPMAYGADRTLLHWMIDKAVKSKSPVVSWKTATQYLKDVGISRGGKSRQELKERYLRLSGLTIGIVRRGTSDQTQVMPLIVRANLPNSIDVRREESGSSGDVPMYGFRIGETFFDEVSRHHVPVPFQLLSALRKRSQMQDIALFLYWRSFAAGSETLIPWASLREQMWQDDTNLWRMRGRVNDAIKALRTVWPELNAKVETDGLRIGPPSRHLLDQAAVVRRLSSK